MRLLSNLSSSDGKSIPSRSRELDQVRNEIHRRQISRQSPSHRLPPATSRLRRRVETEPNDPIHRFPAEIRPHRNQANPQSKPKTEAFNTNSIFRIHLTSRTQFSKRKDLSCQHQATLNAPCGQKQPISRKRFKTTRSRRKHSPSVNSPTSTHSLVLSNRLQNEAIPPRTENAPPIRDRPVAPRSRQLIRQPPSRPGYPERIASNDAGRGN